MTPEPPPPPRVTVLVLASGGSTRMRGSDKLVAPLFGSCLLRRSAEAAAGSAAARTIVILRPEDDARQTALAGLGVSICRNTRWKSGMSSAIGAGISALGPGTRTDAGPDAGTDAGTDAVIIALADMPEITSADHDRLIAAFAAAPEGAICRATGEGGAPGHPVLFSRRYFGELGRLTGDRGARAVVARHREAVIAVPLAGGRALRDLDTPEDWQSYTR